MGETDVHIEQIFELRLALRTFFSSMPDVYVASNMLLFYEKGNRRKHVSPDVMVIRGVPRKRRRSYHLWLEGKAPEVVIEVTSESTCQEDLVTKKILYARLGVQEYFLFDPLREYLPTQLMGFRLTGQEYVPVIGSILYSSILGLELHLKDDVLRLYDPARQSWLETSEEVATARKQAERQAAAAEKRADEAEKEVTNLRERLRRLQDLEG